MIRCHCEILNPRNASPPRRPFAAAKLCRSVDCSVLYRSAEWISFPRGGGRRDCRVRSPTRICWHFQFSLVGLQYAAPVDCRFLGLDCRFGLPVYVACLLAWLSALNCRRCCCYFVFCIMYFLFLVFFFAGPLAIWDWVRRMRRIAAGFFGLNWPSNPLSYRFYIHIYRYVHTIYGRRPFPCIFCVGSFRKLGCNWISHWFLGLLLERSLFLKWRKCARGSINWKMHNQLGWLGMGMGMRQGIADPFKGVPFFFSDFDLHTQHVNDWMAFW